MLEPGVNAVGLGNMLRRVSEDFGGDSALCCENVHQTYAEFHARTDALYLSLLELGLRQGDRVAILMENCLEFVEVFFAVAKMGGTVVPLNTFLAAPEVEYILKDCAARCVVGQHRLLQKARVHEIEGLKWILCVDGDTERSMPYAPLVDRDTRGTLGREVHPDETAVILYTSGTTGKPKGVMLTHRNLYANAEQCLDATQATRKDSMFVVLPMFHAYTFLAGILTPVMVGARIIVVKSIRPFNRILREIAFKRPTVFIGIPPIYNILAQKKMPRLMRYFNPIRMFVSAAAPLNQEVMKRFEEEIQVPLLDAYGLSEASPAVSFNRMDRERKPGSVGLPLPGVQIKIVDEEENELPVGQCGEIIVRGPNVMKGYLNLKEDTARAIRSGWLFTGDMGRLDEEGYLYIMDRKKDLILVHGMNVYPREVEDVLCQHPAVEYAAVVGRDDGQGERVIAVVQLREGETVAARELREFCRDRMAMYKMPHQILFRSSLPMTPTMKVLKRELRAELAREREELSQDA